MSNPLISVIVPIYNVEDYLRRCVDSIINQSYKNLEIILVDDGSPDNSPKICDEYIEKDNRIKVVHKKNGGLSDARNAGMEVATGEYVSFIDSDDWIDVDFINSLYNGIKSGADVAECATRLVDNDDNTLSTRGSKEGKISREEALAKLITEDGVYQTVWNKLYKRSQIEELPFAVGKYHEDDFWTWRVFLKMDKLYLCEKPMYNYLQNRSNSIIGSSYSLKKLDGIEARYERMLGLKDIEVAGDLAVIAFVNTLIYSMQSSVKYLSKEDKATALKILMDYKRKVKLTATQYNMMTKKERMWIRLFMLMPRLTAEIRSKTGIGF
ncbi:MAG: glycosyltransferase [Acutalibacteraceae bacterium]|nr:glycosyltransferase [Acutalibacteraceae bacterium]